MQNSNAIYMTGNGHIAAAYCGGDLVQLFGPPYSSPSLFQSRFPKEEKRSLPQRLPHTAIWQITLGLGARVTDFALPKENAIVRHIDSEQAVTFQLFAEKEELFDYKIELAHTKDETVFLLKTRDGNPLYNDYPLTFPQFYGLLIRGDAQCREEEAYRWQITVQGQADILFVGGPDYPHCDTLLNTLRRRPYAQMLEETRESWEKRFSKMTVFQKIPGDLPRRQELLDALEGTTVAILVQQAAEGGVLAGYNYHLGYVRDQFGVCMALLKLGLVAEARAILQFYADVFHRSGKILNAQAMGVEGIFHFAENDSSELPGYLLLQFFRYADKSGDWALIEQNETFLQWLYTRQLPELSGGMMPFNGDETYIAGGLLPRDVINDGSAEATMLFILSGERLLDYYKTKGLRTTEELAQMESTLQQTRAAYEKNFAPEGKYILNNPARCSCANLPEYRYGVCMNLGADDCSFFGWTKRCEDDVYLCPKCQQKKTRPARKKDVYALPSALLMPEYLQSDLLDKKIIRRYLEEADAALTRDGRLYSDEEKEKNVGYDYGLLLYNLTVTGIGHAENVYHKLLNQLDEAGTWAEYYVQDRPCGTRYRPWESAINIDALLTWVETRK